MCYPKTHRHGPTQPGIELPHLWSHEKIDHKTPVGYLVFLRAESPVGSSSQHLHSRNIVVAQIHLKTHTRTMYKQTDTAACAMHDFNTGLMLLLCAEDTHSDTRTKQSTMITITARIARFFM